MALPNVSCPPGRTHRSQKQRREIATLGYQMAAHTIELPKTGFALEIDGRLKAEFSTKAGAEQGAVELKRRFPMLQIHSVGRILPTPFLGGLHHLYVRV